MSSYSGTADTPSKAKAIVAVVAVHALLAAAILTGLNVRVVSDAVERLQMIDVRLAPPPPEPPPPPARESKKVELEEGAAGKKADPSPVVAPKPHIPVHSPLPAAPVAGTGSATSSGAATLGSGTGAGGSGTGRGGGGDYSKFTPARRISKIPDGQYRRFRAASGMSQGRVGLTVKVNPDGRPSNCRIVKSSGNGIADSLMCELTLQYVRFRPALDADGRPVAQDISWFPDWSPK